LSQIARALEHHSVDPRAPEFRRWRTSWWLGLAGCAAGVLLAGLAWRVFRPPGAGWAPPQPPVEIALDLGAGQTRAHASPPILSLPASVVTVRIRLLPPVNPGATYAASLTHDDREVTEGIPLGPLDPMGAAEVAIAVATLQDPGVYEVRLRVTEM